MQRKPIPEIKVQSPSMVEASMNKNELMQSFYSKMNQIPELSRTTPPKEYYEANETDKSLYFTAIDDLASLEDEDEPPYIDLDKDLKPNSFQNVGFLLI